MNALTLTELQNRSFTDEYASAWAHMGISKDWQIKRLTDWANMLERRVADLDPNYRAYPYGKGLSP